MNLSTPHYLLLTEASRTHDCGRWQFSLRTSEGAEELAVTDVEPAVRGDRLDLLTVVRALEALDQPSQVTLVGCSAYVQHGMRYGLPEWRSSGWRWEFFGEMVPVKNGDLWQRLDRAMRFHRVECRHWRVDGPHRSPQQRQPESRRAESHSVVEQGGGSRNVGVFRGIRGAAGLGIRYAWLLVPARWRQWLAAVASQCRRLCAFGVAPRRCWRTA